MSVVPSAGAEGIVFTATCRLDLTITFHAPNALLSTSSSPYDIKADAARSSCGYVPDGAPIGFTFANGSAGVDTGTSFARCGVLAGIGSWNEGLSLTTLYGSHVLAGSWFAATMFVSSLPSDPIHFTGAIALVPADVNEMLAKQQACALGAPVVSIHMIGTEVLNDPS